MNAHEPGGLTSAEAATRLAEHGPNAITRAAAVSPWRLLAGQFKSPMIALLLGAGLLSGLLGEVADAIAIGAIVLINALVGFFQEYRAERALEALRAMTAPRARVIRDGRTVALPAVDLVPGDLLVLEAGDVIAADAHLREVHALSTNEAPLTGESMPVEKRAAGETPPAGPLAERFDQVFMGTAVVVGTGLAEVFAIGMQTELGRIAHLLNTAEEGETPLQRRLAQIGRTLLILCLAVVALVAIFGVLHGRPWTEWLLSAVSLAVAAIPEGLAAIVTVSLAVGVQRLAAQHALIRRLPAVETLGSTTVICTDKTGTLTTGVMAMRELWGPRHSAILDAAAACCDAELDASGSGGIGDPTEIALLAAAAARGIQRAATERERARVDVFPFDADRKRMSILRADGVLYVKGAPELLFPLCTGGTEGAAEANVDLAARGLRVLGVAVGRGPGEQNLELLGLVGLADPPRPEAIAAIAEARGAGVRTVMITGDQEATARAIGLELGLYREGESPDEVVHARATPEDKLRIVRAWKAKGEVVAMTGDGVNDAPALREAHIGIAMGRSGTEVTREAADMVLTDDNYATIVAAVREGRGIYENIRKTLIYLLAGNAAELMLMLGAAVAGLPAPLLPLHLLWINLATDGLPALALVMDPTSPDILKHPPRRPDAPMLGRAEWLAIAWTGALQATIALSVFIWALNARGLEEARNLSFSVLVFGELLRAFAARSPTALFWEVGAFSNLRLLGVVVLSILTQLAIHHIPTTQDLFDIGPLSLSDCALSLGLGFIPVTVLEVAKLVSRRPDQGRFHHIDRSETPE